VTRVLTPAHPPCTHHRPAPTYSHNVVRVAIAEDDYLVREGVRALLDHDATVEVVGSYPDSSSLLAEISRHGPEVVITDIRMPPSWVDEGLALAEELGRSAPEIGVVVLSQIATPEYAARIFANGAERRAYVLKDRVADRAGLVHVVHEVAGGGSFVDPNVVVSLVSTRTASPSPLDDLTPRERDVLVLVAEGLSNGAIAERLHLTKRSVEGNINSIFFKLELPDEQHVSRRVAAALLFLSESAR
jgi:DNA-binding NarL/FixJ family response regulator